LPEVAQHMTRLSADKPGHILKGSKDEMFPTRNVQRLQELVPALSLTIKEGLPARFVLNLNKDGGPTSCETIESILSIVDARMAALH
jgi:hypothetical protein